LLTKVIIMYIVLSKTSNKTAVIKNQTELAGYLNKVVSTVRRNLKDVSRWETENFIVIKPDYIQIKSNSGGKRYPKEREY
jgi:hypothetical protein